MRTNLDTDPRVIAMSAELTVPELHVVGMLWKVWSWADQHTIDGNAIRVTSATLDRFTCVAGFSNALRSVGWLEGVDGSLTFPRFTEHNGTTAKKRAEGAVRVQKHRSNEKDVTDVTQESLPEKRRVDKSREEEKDTNTGTKFARPTVEEVREYCQERDNNIDPQAFVDHYDANGWKVGGRAAMKDWRASIRTWEKRPRDDAPPADDKQTVQPRELSQAELIAEMDRAMNGGQA